MLWRVYLATSSDIDSWVPLDSVIIVRSLLLWLAGWLHLCALVCLLQHNLCWLVRLLGWPVAHVKVDCLPVFFEIVRRTLLYGHSYLLLFWSLMLHQPLRLISVVDCHHGSIDLCFSGMFVIPFSMFQFGQMHLSPSFISGHWMSSISLIP